MPDILSLPGFDPKVSSYLKIKAILADLKQRSLVAWDLRDLTAEKFWQMESKPPSYQRIILSALDSAESASLLSESPSTKRRIQSASGQYALQLPLHYASHLT